MQDRSRDADVENSLWTQWGKGVVGRLESSTDIYTPLCVKQTANGKLLYRHGELNLALCDNLEGCAGVRAGAVQDGGDIYVLLADSRCCMAKANTIL